MLFHACITSRHIMRVIVMLCQAPSIPNTGRPGFRSGEGGRSCPSASWWAWRGLQHDAPEDRDVQAGGLAQVVIPHPDLVGAAPGRLVAVGELGGQGRRRPGPGAP